MESFAFLEKHSKYQRKEIVQNKYEEKRIDFIYEEGNFSIVLVRTKVYFDAKDKSINLISKTPKWFQLLYAQALRHSAEYNKTRMFFRGENQFPLVYYVKSKAIESENWEIYHSFRIGKELDLSGYTASERTFIGKMIEEIKEEYGIQILINPDGMVIAN